MTPKSVVAVVGLKGAFDRLVQGLAAWAREHPDASVWVQHGEGALAEGLTGEPSLAREDLLDRLRRADAVVVHGGSGSIRDALVVGHVPVVVPRRAALGEHVNDHQQELAEALGDRVVVCANPEEWGALGKALVEAAGRRSVRVGTRLPGDALRQALREELELCVRDSPSWWTRCVFAVLALTTWWVRVRTRQGR